MMSAADTDEVGWPEPAALVIGIESIRSCVTSWCAVCNQVRWSVAVIGSSGTCRLGLGPVPERDARGRATMPCVPDALAHASDGLAELRELAAGVHPSILTNRGLQAAIAALAQRNITPVSVDVPGERFRRMSRPRPTSSPPRP
jgi:hypothetical protein